MTNIKACRSWNFGQIPLLTTDLAALDQIKKIMYNVVTTLVPLFSIGSS